MIGVTHPQARRRVMVACGLHQRSERLGILHIDAQWKINAHRAVQLLESRYVVAKIGPGRHRISTAAGIADGIHRGRGQPHRRG